MQRAIVNRQQINHENPITSYTFSKPLTGWKPVNWLTGFPLYKPILKNTNQNVRILDNSYERHMHNIQCYVIPQHTDSRLLCAIQILLLTYLQTYTP